MRVIFVGIHNKPGMMPLDSSTLSGKTVDRIIEKVKHDKFVKANLFDIDHFPSTAEANSLLHKFAPRVGLEAEDIVVWLGSDVRRFARGVYICTNLYVPHPSLRFSPVPRGEYIDIVAGKINEELETNKLLHIGRSDKEKTPFSLLMDEILDKLRTELEEKKKALDFFMWKYGTELEHGFMKLERRHMNSANALYREYQKAKEKLSLYEETKAKGL